MIFEQLLFQAKEGDLESITDILFESGETNLQVSGIRNQI